MTAPDARAVTIIGWGYIGLAAVHIGSATLTLLSPPEPALAAANRAMEHVAVPLSTHSYLVTSNALSYLMAVFLAATGTVALLASRHRAEAPRLTRSLLGFLTATSGVGFAFAFATLPLPPVLVFGALFGVGVWGLIPVRRR